MAFRVTNIGIEVALKPGRAKKRIKAALKAAGGNVSAAAKVLGVHRDTLNEMRKKLGLVSA